MVLEESIDWTARKNLGWKGTRWGWEGISCYSCSRNRTTLVAQQPGLITAMSISGSDIDLDPHAYNDENRASCELDSFDEQ